MMKMFASVNFAKHKYKPAGNKNTKIWKNQVFVKNFYVFDFFNKFPLEIFSDQSVNSHHDPKLPGVDQMNESHRQFDFDHYCIFFVILREMHFIAEFVCYSRVNQSRMMTMRSADAQRQKQ